MTSIYKKGVKSEPLNYRPVSLTCVMCKILEKITKQGLLGELSNQNWFIAAQRGLTTSRSTMPNLVEFYDGVTEDLDNGHNVDIIFLDLANPVIRYIMRSY